MTPHPAADSPSGRAPSPGSAGTRWRVVDIVVTAILGVAVGVVFLGWSVLSPVFDAWFAAYPPLRGLIAGMWVLAAPLGGLLIRKPGAALFCEMIAAATEAAAGSRFGMVILLTGALQGLGAEVVFWWLRRRRLRQGKPAASGHTLWTTLAAGLGAGVAMSIGDNIIFNAAWSLDQMLVYAVLGWISGIVLAGGLSWLIYRALLPTGALSAFASGRYAPGRATA